MWGLVVGTCGGVVKTKPKMGLSQATGWKPVVHKPQAGSPQYTSYRLEARSTQATGWKPVVRADLETGDPHMAVTAQEAVTFAGQETGVRAPSSAPC